MTESYMDTVPRKMDGNTKSLISWPVGKYLTGSIQVGAENLSAWSSAVVEVVRSNDGITFYSMPTAVTLSSPGMTDSLDVSGWAYVGLQVITVNGGALTILAWGCFKA